MSPIRNTEGKTGETNVTGKALGRLTIKTENSHYQEEGMNTDHTNSKKNKRDSIIDNFMARTYIKLTRALKDLNINYQEGRHIAGHIFGVPDSSRGPSAAVPMAGVHLTVALGFPLFYRLAHIQCRIRSPYLCFWSIALVETAEYFFLPCSMQTIQGNQLPRLCPLELH